MEKDIFNINKNQLSYGRGYVYSLQYHLVWCTKYRKKVLKDGIDLECKKMLQDLAEEYRFQILAMEVMPDHIHMLVDCRPQFYISDMIKIMQIISRFFRIFIFRSNGYSQSALLLDSVKFFLIFYFNK